MLIKPIQFTKEVETLLVNEDLPASDLSTSTNIKLFGMKLDNKLVGLIGVELENNIGLLRSLVVSSDVRQSGCGTRLVKHLETWAIENKIDDLYLLTTTAKTYFLKIGYKVVSRDLAPPFIINTPQFSGLCPSSADFMHKHLSQ